MRNGLDRAAPENAKQAFSGEVAAKGETDFELIQLVDSLYQLNFFVVQVTS